MDLGQVLFAGGLLTAILVVNASMWSLVRTQRAQRDLERRLVDQLRRENVQDRQRRFARLCALAAQLEGNPGDEHALRDAHAIIEALLTTMKPSHRLRMRSALRQPARAGRASYAQTVITESIDAAVRSMDTSGV